MKKTTPTLSKPVRKRAAAKPLVKKVEADDRIIVGSGNVFADLGLPNPDLLLQKAELVSKINGILTAKKLTQAKTGELLGIAQPEVSLLSRGRLDKFTVDRLIRFLDALGHEVRMSVVARA